MAKKKKPGRPLNKIRYERRSVIIPDDVFKALTRLAKKNGTKVHAEMVAGIRERVGLAIVTKE